jgi:hypothetical protein
MSTKDYQYLRAAQQHVKWAKKERLRNHRKWETFMVQAVENFLWWIKTSP